VRPDHPTALRGPQGWLEGIDARAAGRKGKGGVLLWLTMGGHPGVASA
jgi:hypothetical protein